MTRIPSLSMVNWVTRIYVGASLALHLFCKTMLELAATVCVTVGMGEVVRHYCYAKLSQ